VLWVTGAYSHFGVSGAETSRERAEIVVMGASAGGVHALSEVVRSLPADFPAAVLVVLHVAASSPSLLPRILDRTSALPSSAAQDGDRIEPGHIYVAPPDLHLVVDGDTLRLTATARVNGHRPAVDPLFCAAAHAHRERVVGVVLSGTRDDGTVGLAQIKECGGVTIVQDPEDALYDGMPTSAIEHVAVDAILPASEIGAALVELATAGSLPGSPRSSSPVVEVEVPGHLLITICPECGGVLTEHSEAGLSVFECHVGHSYGPRTLAAAQGSGVEASLWTAIRVLEDRKALLERLATQAHSRGQIHSERHFTRQVEQSTLQADRIREVVAGLAETTGLGDPFPLERDDQIAPLRQREESA
jgi:two-component system chemotaxis response regulator CheB